MNRIALPCLLLTLALAGCSGDEQPATGHAVLEPSRSQLAAAEELGVPVEFENDLGMRFVLVPPGTFTFGSPDDEVGREREEVEVVVTFEQAFYVQTTEVTNAQYRACVPDHHVDAFHGHALDGDRQPAAAVTWYDARDYGRWLSRRDPRRTYQLPTKQQWEYACRAGTSTRFWWGDDLKRGCKFANALDPVTLEVLSGPLTQDGAWRWTTWPCDDGYRVAAPVASYPPNPWGLFDVHGNVCEWCADEPRPLRGFQGTSLPMEDAGHRVEPDPGVGGPSEPALLAHRGGAWAWDPRLCRAARDSAESPRLTGAYWLGFRLVSPLPNPADD